MFLFQPPQFTQPHAVQTAITMVSKDVATDAGEPVRYLSTPNPEVTSMILTLPPGGKTDWMTHPVPGYVYILEGQLTVEFVDGTHVTFKAGQAFMQARAKWHRGVNEGQQTMKFLAVFFGEKDSPVIVNPPQGSVVNGR